jgi:hypothetical protein
VMRYDIIVGILLQLIHNSSNTLPSFQLSTTSLHAEIWMLQRSLWNVEYWLATQVLGVHGMTQRFAHLEQPYAEYRPKLRMIKGIILMILHWTPQSLPVVKHNSVRSSWSFFCCVTTSIMLFFPDVL